MLERNGKNNSDGTFDWKDSVIDAGIMAGLTFFTSLGGFSAIGVPEGQVLVGACISAGAQFFLALAIKRGLREKGTEPE